MLKKLRKSNQGFTIIEVLIVLAIAGLILLIVFLAVPALQRNSRNTTIKNDAASVAGAISEYESNNNGGAPASITGTGTITVGATGTTQATANVNGSTTVNTTAATATFTPSATAPAAGTLQAWLGHKCSGTASSRAIAIYYPIEQAGGLASNPGCVDS